MANREGKAKDSNREIELLSCDEKSVKVKASLLEKFTWFSAMINFEPNRKVFTLKHVSEKHLEKIIEWMEYEGSGEMPALIDPETKSFRKLTTWEETFAKKIADGMLVELMIDADFFAMKNFLEILTSVASSRIVVYPIQQIRDMFHIKESGYTPQEEQKLESEIQWALRFQD